MFYVVEDDAGAFWIVPSEHLEMGMTVVYKADTYDKCWVWLHADEVQPSN